MAKLAGVPPRVISRARKILEELEQEGGVPAPARQPDDQEQVSMDDMAGQEILKQLRMLEVNTLTPIEAMNLLYEWKGKL